MIAYTSVLARRLLLLTACFVPGTALAQLTVPPTSTGSYTVTWTAMSGGQTRAYLYESTNGGPWVRMTVTGTNSRSFSKPPGTYSYKFQTCFFEPEIGQELCDAFSDEATVVVSTSTGLPGVPGSLGEDVTTTTGTLTLSWSAASGTVSRYELEERPSGSAWNRIHNSIVRMVTLTRGDGEYDYRVRACNASGCGGYTPIKRVTVRRIPGMPGSLGPDITLAPITYTVNWGAAPGTVTRYELHERTNGVWAVVHDSPARHRTFVNKPVGVYEYRARACNPSGCGAFTGIKRVTIELEQNINGPTTAGSYYTLSWAPSPDEAELQERVPGGAWRTIVRSRFRTSAFFGKGVGTYEYRLRRCIPPEPMFPGFCFPWGRIQTVTVSSLNPCPFDPASQCVVLEVDKMADATFPPVSIQPGTGPSVSLPSIFNAAGQAGLAVNLIQDDTAVDWGKSSITEAELHQLMVDNRDFTETSTTWAVHQMVSAVGLAREPDVLGAMFDWDVSDLDGVPREGFAVFYPAHTDSWTGERLQRELLLSSTHEMGHCFNLHHEDWEGESFMEGSTVMSYSITDTVLWRLSSRSIAHVRDHRVEYVKPGSGGKPFATITQEHCDLHQPVPGSMYVCESPAGRAAGGLRDLPAASDGPIRLKLSAERPSFQLAEPWSVHVELSNTGNEAARVIKYLKPDFLLTGYVITRPGGERISYRPVTIKRGRSAKAALGPGKTIRESVKLFFGSKGWIFDRPGAYRIKAMHSSPDGGHVVSNELEIRIVQPADEAHERAAKTMLTGPVGIFLLWEGGDQFDKGIAALQTVATELPDTLHAAYANYALGMNLSQDQGKRRADFITARRYLEQAWTLAQEKEVTDEMRRKLLPRMADVYKELGNKTKRDEMLREFRERFPDANNP